MTRRDFEATVTGSTLAYLEGGLSGERYPADTPMQTDPVDGRPLLARYDPERAAGLLEQSLLGPRSRGLWRWAPLLPVREWRHVASLGEGGTPLVEAPRLAAALGCPGLLVKAESGNPTGSFKARGMSVALSRAVELGATSVVVPSSGNAGGALAAYGALAGVPVTVVMPTDSSPIQQQDVLLAGARLVLVDGLVDDCGRVSTVIAEATGAFDISTLKEPYRAEGKKTMGLELAEDLGWELPDVIVYPTGGGTGIVGMWKAFAELEAMGWIGPRRPRMVCVQAAGCAPLVRAIDRGERFAEPWVDAATRATGLLVPHAVGDFLIHDAITESGGRAVAVEEQAIDESQALAASHGLTYVSPETGAALAAVVDLREQGGIEPDDRVVVFSTGIGYKSTPPPYDAEPTATVPADASRDEVLTLVSR